MKLKLIGSKITKIDAERKPEFSGKISLNTNIHVASIVDYKAEMNNVPSIKIDASLKIDYTDLGYIEIRGNVYITGDTNDLTVITEAFNAKKFDDPAMVQIMNVIMQKFSIKAFDIQEELGLPIHITLPTLKHTK